MQYVYTIMETIRIFPDRHELSKAPTQIDHNLLRLYRILTKQKPIERGERVFDPFFPRQNPIDVKKITARNGWDLENSHKNKFKNTAGDNHPIA